MVEGNPIKGEARQPDMDPPHTVMLEKTTHRAVVEILLHEDNGMDVSDLLNGLLADWVKQHRGTATY